jgi:hypothetical protein
LALVLSAGATVSAATDDDQARLDAAMDAFSDRLTEAGWISVGTPEAGDGSLFDLGRRGWSDECLDTAAWWLDGSEQLPGETARSASDGYASEELEAQATDPVAFLLEGEIEGAVAFAVAVDDANVEVLSEFVEFIGSDETAACVEDEMVAGFELPGDDEIDISDFAEASAVGHDDLEVGDESAELMTRISARFGNGVEFDVSIHVALIDRSLLSVMYVALGGPASTFDPVAELRAMVDEFG